MTNRCRLGLGCECMCGCEVDHVTNRFRSQALLFVFLQAIEIPFLKVTKKVKSIQMFKEPVQSAKQVHIFNSLSCAYAHATLPHTPTHRGTFHLSCYPYMQGDRVGICVTQFDPKQVERCLVCSPGHLPTLYGQLIDSSCCTYAACENRSHPTATQESVCTKWEYSIEYVVRSLMRNQRSTLTICSGFESSVCYTSNAVLSQRP